MSISNTIPAPTIPTKLRILAVVMHSGVAETNLEGWSYTTAPYAEILVQACDPIVDTEGNAVLNPFGLPVYADYGQAKSFKINDPAKLVPFLGNWSTLIDAAEAELANRITEGSF